MKNKTFTFSFFYLTSNALIKALGFLLVAYMASSLSIDGFAAFGLYFSLFNIISTFSYNSIIEVIISKNEYFKNRTEERKTYSFVLFFIFCAVLFIGVCIYVYFDGGGTFDYNNLIVYLSAIFVSFFLLIASIIRLEENHKQSILIQFIPAFLGYVFAFVALKVYNDAISYYYGIIVGGIISIPLFLKYFKFVDLIKQVDYKYLIQLIKNIVPFLVLAIVSWFQGYGGLQILKEFFDSYQIGLYLFIITISAIVQIVANSLNQVWSPKFYNIFNEETLETINKKCTKFTFFQAIILGIVSFGIIVMYNICTGYFEFFHKFKDAEFGLSLILAACLINIPWWQYQNYLLIKDKGAAILNINLVSITIGLLSWILLMSLYQESAIYYGLLIFNLTRTLISGYYIYRQYKFAPSFIGIGLGLVFNFISLFLIEYL